MYKFPMRILFSLFTILLVVNAQAQYIAGWHALNKFGEPITTDKYQSEYLYSEGLRAVPIDNLYGFVDKNEKMIIAPAFKYGGNFIGGYALVYTQSQLQQDIIDISGKVLNTADMYVMSNFKNGRALVRVQKKYGFINKTGKLIIPAVYNDAFDFFNGLAVARGSSGDYGMIDTNGIEKIPFVYKNMANLHEGFIWVNNGNETGFLNKQGKVVIPFQYQAARSFSNGLAAVKINNYWGFINPAGMLIIPAVYNDIEPFVNGVAVVQKDKRYGLINSRGNAITAFKYEDIDEFKDGRARFYANKKFGFLDVNGTEVVPAIYQDAMFFVEGYARVKYNDLIGFIDTAGKVAVGFKYVEAKFFSDGITLVKDINPDDVAFNKHIEELQEELKNPKSILYNSYNNYNTNTNRIPADPARERQAVVAYGEAVKSYNMHNTMYGSLINKFAAAGDAGFLYKETYRKAELQLQLSKDVLKKLLKDHGDYLPDDTYRYVRRTLQDLPMYPGVYNDGWDDYEY